MNRVIGVDPGARVGFAVVNDGELVLALTLSWREQRAELATAFAFWGGEGVRAVVETPKDVIWGRPGVGGRAMLRIARNVGQCRERADEIALALRRLGCEVISRPPIRGGTKRGLHIDTWRAMFPEWGRRRISNHARDAAVLAKLMSPR